MPNTPSGVGAVAVVMPTPLSKLMPTRWPPPVSNSEMRSNPHVGAGNYTDVDASAFKLPKHSKVISLVSTTHLLSSLTLDMFANKVPAKVS